ncbi:hypothetical protein FHT32_005073 [Variovorax sp. SG517]|nr:hypothetical protein [Variovorax sp. SG517]
MTTLLGVLPESGAFAPAWLQFKTASIESISVFI